MLRDTSNRSQWTRESTNNLRLQDLPLHPAWLALIRYCAQLQYGEIELLKIQDGVPVLAEIVKKKIRFAP